MRNKKIITGSHPHPAPACTGGGHLSFLGDVSFKPLNDTFVQGGGRPVTDGTYAYATAFDLENTGIFDANYYYAASFDVSNPASPTLLDRVQLSSSAITTIPSFHGCVLDGNILYATSCNQAQVQNATLDVIDVSNPASMSILWTADLGMFTAVSPGLLKVGGSTYLVIPNTLDGDFLVHIFDVTTQGGFAQVATFDARGDSRQPWIVGTRYVSGDNAGGAYWTFRVWDLSTPATPTEVGHFDGEHGTPNFDQYWGGLPNGTTLWIFNWDELGASPFTDTGNLQTFDLTNLAAITLLDSKLGDSVNGGSGLIVMNDLWQDSKGSIYLASGKDLFGSNFDAIQGFTCSKNPLAYGDYVDLYSGAPYAADLQVGGKGTLLCAWMTQSTSYGTPFQALLKLYRTS